MLDAIVGGRLHGRPVQRTGSTGNAFTTAKLVATTGNGESLLVNVIAFGESAQAALLALEAGDSVAVTGPLTPKVWTTADGKAKVCLDLNAHGVLTQQVTRKHRAPSGDQEWA